jgi:uncharacterized membrane protein YgdD (TMEM256/DUF423 family)
MKLFLIAATINGFLAVALGAFGAHGLEGKLTEKALNTWGTAVQYQMFHTIALFATAFLAMKANTTMNGAGWAFLIGIFLFSGSLYIYALTQLKFFAMITPLGGVAFLIGWILLCIGAIKHF